MKNPISANPACPIIILYNPPLLISLAAPGGNVLYVTSHALNQLSIAEESMKRKVLSGSFLLMLAALISIGGTPSATGQSNTNKDYEERLITVLNPAISTTLAERVPLGPRLATLEGKTIYLVDMQWGGPEAAFSVFEEMQAWFSKNMPSVKIVIKRMGSGPFGDDPSLRKEIVDKKVDGVITGIAG
jgi:hypothetical protein